MLDCKGKYLMTSVPGSRRPTFFCEDQQWHGLFDVTSSPYQFKGDEIVMAESLPCDPAHVKFVGLKFSGKPFHTFIRVIHDQ